MAKRKDPTDIGGLTPHPTSHGRSHSERGIGILTDGLQKVGFGRAVLIGRNNQIIAGHATIEAAAAAGITELQIVESDGRKVIAIRRSDLTDEQAVVMGLLDNRAGDFSDWQPGTVEEVWKTQREEIAFMFTEHEVHKIADGADRDRGDRNPDALPDLRRTTIQLGDVFELGAHRLVCGDMTEAAARELLMRDLEAADMIWSDPPYAIYGSSSGIGTDISDDRMVRPFFLKVLEASVQAVKTFGHIYLCCDWRSWPSWWDMAKRAAATPKNLIVWYKGGGGLGASYANCYECIGFFAKLPRQQVMISDDRRGQRVVHAPNLIEFHVVPSGQREHNAQKPVDVISEQVRLSSDRGDTIVDWFIGSGSSMMACEELGRNCYGMDIDPKYIQVAIDRWEKVTSGRARKVHGAPARTKKKAAKKRKAKR